MRMNMIDDVATPYSVARFPFARRQLIGLAASFEYRARHLGRYES
jgi:hypothetical protein